MRYYCVEFGEALPALARREDGQYVAVEVPEQLEKLRNVAFAEVEPGRELGETGASRLAPPTCPTKIVCVGRNYRQHARELDNPIPDEPLIFLKPPSSLISHGEAIEVPEQSDEVHHEAELACIIGERVRRRANVDARSAIAAYTCANDVTARDLQNRDKTFTRGKGFDTFCPAGPVLVDEASFDPEDHRIVGRVDGSERQNSRLNDFIFSIPEIISFISHIMTLEPGDLVLTGTPSGVGPLEVGSEVEVSVDGIGTLRNSVERRQPV